MIFFVPCYKMANEKMILVPYNKLAIEVVPCYKLANDILCAMNHSIPVLIAEREGSIYFVKLLSTLCS